MELDAGCGKLGEECRAGRADAFAQVAAVCDKSWMVYIAPEGEGEEEDNGAMLFQVSDLLEKTNMVVPQGPECTIKNEVNNEYCVLDFKTELETGCLSDKKRCNEEDETAKVCNR